MQLEWRSPLGCPCPQLASELTSALPSHYSPRAAGGQRYQVEWCYKINWTLHWGKCWRWWTERVPAENQSSSLKPPSESDWDFRAKQLDYRLGMQSELNMSARQAWRVGHPSLSALWRCYLHTPSAPVRNWNRHTWLHRGCLRIADGGHTWGEGNRCRADTHSRRHRAELLSLDTLGYNNARVSRVSGKFTQNLCHCFDSNMRANSDNISALVISFAKGKEPHLMSAYIIIQLRLLSDSYHTIMRHVRHLDWNKWNFLILFLI